MKAFIRKSWQIALTSIALLTSVSDSNAQKEYYWGQTDIPYIEQRGFSLGFNFGLADMWADVGTKSPIDHYSNNKYWDETRFMGGLFVRYSHVPGLAFRLAGNFGKLYANDNWNEEKALTAPTIYDDAYQRYFRNLNVRTNIWEASLTAEIAPLRLFSDWEFGKSSWRRFQPYLVLGVGVFNYNPQGLYKDYVNHTEKWYDLRPLRTEGQGYNFEGAPKAYGSTAFSAIGGLGVKWEIGSQLAVGLEWQLRMTFTDYLDDVSGKYVSPILHEIANNRQLTNKADLVNRMADPSWVIIPDFKRIDGTLRGDPDNNDMFSTLSVTFYWKIFKNATPWWQNFN